MTDANLYWTLAGKAFVALSPVLLAALSWLSFKATALINQKTRSEALRTALTRLDDAAFAAAREAESVVVQKLKETMLDGVLSEQDRREVRDATVDSIRRQLGLRGIVETSKALGLTDPEMNQFLATRAQSAAHELKRMNGAAVRSSYK